MHVGVGKTGSSSIQKALESFTTVNYEGKTKYPISPVSGLFSEYMYHAFENDCDKDKSTVDNVLSNERFSEFIISGEALSVKYKVIKGSKFNLSSFLIEDDLVKKFEGGSMLIVRLAPTDYHRYHFPASGPASESKLIKGPLYSVNPIALDKSLEIFCQNKRTICVQQSNDYGDIAYSDVGATAVGTIHQTYTPNVPLEKGAEKGYFAFGGSTVVLFFEKGKIQFDQDLIDNTKNGIETAVEMGDTIAR